MVQARNSRSLSTSPTVNGSLTRSDRILLLLLRTLGGITLLAAVAVFIPLDWMGRTHSWLGMGELPTLPLLEYLARTLSAFYSFFGALCLLAATDLIRYRPLVRFLGISLTVMGVVFLGVDMLAGMPAWWSACESLPIAVGLALSVLTRRSQTRDDSETIDKS